MGRVKTSSEIITEALRRGLIPADQATFTCCDILDIANEELGIHMVPLVLRAHEEYYIRDCDIVSCVCELQYRIPYRAIGNKLRDVQFVNSAGTYFEMTRISIEDRPDCAYSSYSRLNTGFLAFYVENDEIVLKERPVSTGSFRMSYFIRPNNLVKDDRGAKISAISNQFACATITCFANLVSGTDDAIVVAGVTFTATACAAVSGAATFQAATTNAATATSLSSQINANACASALVTASVVCCTIVKVVADASTLCLTLTYTDNDCNVGATVSVAKTEFTLCTFPTHFSTTCVYDIIQGRSPNKIKSFDICVSSTCTVNKKIAFPVSGLQKVDLESNGTRKVNFAVGDYVMKAEETIVAQVPQELVSVLAQRITVKMLEALGDTEGYGNAQKELERMEYNAMTLIDNRVEGAARKIVNKHSTLRQSTKRKIY
jgi:hypothetical protein